MLVELAIWEETVENSKQANINLPALTDTLNELDKLISDYEYLVGIEDRIDAEDLPKAREECHQQDRLCEQVLKRLPSSANIFDEFKDTIRRLPECIDDDPMAVRVSFLRSWREKLERHAETFFPGQVTAKFSAQKSHVLTICSRISESAKALRARKSRSTGGKSSYLIEDEYDVQDLLQAVIKASIACTILEEPLGKTAGVKSARVDLALQELGIIIEIKYARNAADQHRFVDDFSKDLKLYEKWPHLNCLIFLVYNAQALQDAEALVRDFTADRQVNDKKFQVFTILS